MKDRYKSHSPNISSSRTLETILEIESLLLQLPQQPLLLWATSRVNNSHLGKLQINPGCHHPWQTKRLEAKRANKYFQGSWPQAVSIARSPWTG
jgi:hypothetical protein